MQQPVVYRSWLLCERSAMLQLMHLLVHECSSKHFVGGSPLSEKETAKSEASGKSPCITHQFSIIFIDMYWQCSNDGGGISCRASVLAELWLHPLGLNSSFLDSYFVCSHACYVQQHPHGFVIQKVFKPSMTDFGMKTTVH